MRAVPGKRSQVCVLVPDGDLPRRELGGLLPESQVEHVVVRAGQVAAQLRAAARRGSEVFVNLCDGRLDGAAPTLEVVWQLERLGLAYTGADARLRGLCRTLMKYVAHVQGVATPAWVVAHSLAACERALALGFPLRVVPAQTGEGEEEAGVVQDEVDLRRRCEALLARCERLVIEREVAGRGYGVVVAGAIEAGGEPRVLAPIETGPRPAQVLDAALDAELRAAARRIFLGFDGEGYARIDFRRGVDGSLYFCEVDFGCRLFAGGVVDAIVANDPLGPAGFLRHILAEAAARHARRLPRYSRRGDASAGFGIFADAAIRAGEVVFTGEERGQRIVHPGACRADVVARGAGRFSGVCIPAERRIVRALGP